MRSYLRPLLALAPIVAAPAAGVPTQSQQAPTAQDPALDALVQEALDHNPDLARDRALVDASKEQIPQAKALPDPTLSLGLQNDGFKGIQVGKMETSYYQVMLTQPFPWPGKRGLRGEIAGVGADISRITTERTRLTLKADVERAYYGLLLVRGQLQLLERQALFLQKAQGITQTRYEVGQGAQADLLRAQLERTRLNQTRLSLEAEERTQLAILNRLRGRREDTAIPTTASLGDLPLPSAPSTDLLMKQAEAKSPELLAAESGVKQADLNLKLAKRDRLPDFAVSAAYMPRGGLDPMWSVGVSVSLPVWSKQKQQRAVSEQAWRRKAQGSETESVRNLLMQRIRERSAQMDSVLGTIRIYREGLLVQSEATFQATLAQYETGRAPFLSVLETLNGWVADRGGLLQALAQAEAIRIAQEEYNLSGTPSISSSGLSAGSLAMGGTPGGSAMATSPSSKSGAAPVQGDSGASSKPM